MRRAVLAIAALIAVPLAGMSQPAGWNDPYPPHRVMDNLYYVGTTMLATFLVATPDGHILINSDYESTVPVIRDNMAELGFSFDDIGIVLGSHAHADHVEADALIQELTGAEVMAARGDVPALREIRPGGKEHPIDRILDDGDEVTLGGTTLTAHVMPGHTKGCTSWGMELTEDGQTYQALIVCSLNGGFLQLSTTRITPKSPMTSWRRSRRRARYRSTSFSVPMACSTVWTPSTSNCWPAPPEIPTRSSIPRVTRRTSTSTRRFSKRDSRSSETLPGQPTHKIFGPGSFTNQAFGSNLPER